MMAGMGYGFLLSIILTVALLLGFAYIIWVLASKETGGTKTLGQAISAIIALLVIIIFVVGGLFLGGSKRGMMGMKGCPMGGMMGKMDSPMKSDHMKKMPMDPDTHRKMQEKK
ncbi:MAG: hypothetical protein FD145_1496 [Candidatus Saganbacteria bacterium]|uniref:Uncharacterized protein n=1 Tax=Candidatus Saganbacteria bacterium TaxID=2575572 RepID=A0A833NZG3_UNCSA|nr:MAG: hypothetical protein FD145_1496 [Candidatus Saganbacteria bacterium]